MVSLSGFYLNMPKTVKIPTTVSSTIAFNKEKEKKKYIDHLALYT